MALQCSINIHICWILVPYGKYCVQISSIWLVADGSFSGQKLLSLMESRCYLFFILMLLFLPLRLVHKNSLRTRSISVVPVFLYVFYCFISYIKIFNPFYVSFCVWCQIAFVAFQFSKQRLLKTLLSPLYVFGSLVKN